MRASRSDPEIFLESAQNEPFRRSPCAESAACACVTTAAASCVAILDQATTRDDDARQRAKAPSPLARVLRACQRRRSGCCSGPTEGAVAAPFVPMVPMVLMVSMAPMVARRRAC